MELHLLVAESASDPEDGTLSAKRLGISRIAVLNGQRARANLAIVAFAQYDASDAGQHCLDLTIRDADGAHLGQGIRQEFVVGGEGMCPFPGLEITLDAPPGRYCLMATLDGEVKTTWPLFVDELPPRPVGL